MDDGTGTDDDTLYAVRPATLARATQALFTLRQAIKLGRIDSALSAADVVGEYLATLDREMRS